MAPGNEHDNSTMLWSFPFGLIIGLFMGSKIGIMSGIAFLIGGFWLSPDLDTKSNAQNRWGILGIIWWPYRKLIPHRSIFSHGPLIGTLIRLTYLVALTNLILILLQNFNLDNQLITTQLINKWFTNNQQEGLAIMIGLEASVWLHLIQDGDPSPIEWKKWKQR